jgi:N-acetylmuramoyl-L-alanine amidase
VKKATLGIALLVCAAAGALGWGLAHGARVENEGWPTRGVIPASEVHFPDGFGVRRIYLDAGHGAENNTGNRSAFCRDEQDFTLDLAVDVARELEGTGHFEVELSRRAGELVPYPARVEAAERSGAEAFVSLHSDVRGSEEPWSPEPDRTCPRSWAAPGFSVLWSDEGGMDIAYARQNLARETATALVAIGLVPYDGGEYRGLYDGDQHAGVFVDRHAPSDRIYVLRRPTMPSVIVETHNAWDDREARRWDEPVTRKAFAAALSSALVAVLR